MIINDKRFTKQAEIIREKGTNRSQFFRGDVDKYSWVDLGSSYLPSEIQAAYLWGQLERLYEITRNRLDSWSRYRQGLSMLEKEGKIELPSSPKECCQNGHMFYLKVRDLKERSALLEHLKTDGVYAVFHYVPLHSAPAGQRFGRFSGVDIYTTRESDRLIRLPFWYGLDENTIAHIIKSIRKFFYS
ncbi:DegT/DnrJ/EryC1/StrS family aminotransferase [Marinobacterium aestuariivivens]|uniref:DegT/DnrJ/EryC1/StrS family aminotransferase n=1 Tax=Marinobacterium aestuariivivens TaxID=1698799 RepID=A0ABW1ZWZ8_9GAMM